MILDTVENLRHYAGVHPLLPEVAAFLADPSHADLPRGEHDLGHGLRCIAAAGETVPPGDGRMERHHAHLDVHVPLEGTEVYGFRTRSGCAGGDYDAGADAETLTADAMDLLTVPPRHFVLFLPDDGHRSMLHTGDAAVFVRKLVFKLPLDAAREGATHASHSAGGADAIHSR